MNQIKRTDHENSALWATIGVVLVAVIVGTLFIGMSGGL